MEALFRFLNVGGWTMYAILFCSVLSLAIFLERFFYLRASKILPRRLRVEVEDFVQTGKVQEAITRCKTSDSPLARLVRLVLENKGKPREQLKELVTEAGMREAVLLERMIGALTMIVAVAPMLGFLGTVLGMVDLFSSIAAVGEVTSIGVVADGIYKALYTTVFGLTVAIPTTVFHKYLISRVDQINLELEEFCMRIIDRLS